MELWHGRNAVIFIKDVKKISTFHFEDCYFVNKISQSQSQRLLSRRLEAVDRKVTGLESGGLADGAIKSNKKG